jgi:hypothetical protein
MRKCEYEEWDSPFLKGWEVGHAEFNRRVN